MNIKELCDRYELSSRKTLYSRLNALDMDLSKDNANKSYATDDQIAALDRLNEHLKSGGNLKNYVPLTEVTVDDTTTQHSQNDDKLSIAGTTRHSTQLQTTQHNTQLQVTPQLLKDMVEASTNAIASKLTPKSPTWWQSELEKARANEWLLATSEVKELIGTKPICEKGKKIYKRGCWIFVKAGKIGSQTAWRIMKEQKSDGYNV
jgi:hypothetical protein